MQVLSSDGSSTAGPAAITVLHVDDDPDVCELLARFLERADDRFDVLTATSVTDAMGTLESNDVDCIVSDFDMPTRNGLDLLESVRGDDPDFPFIFFTGKGGEDVASEAISAGVTDYIQKGIGTDQYTLLANRIENAVAKYRAERIAERALRTVEQSGTGIAVLDTDCRITSHNDVFAEMVGDGGDLRQLRLDDIGADHSSDERAAVAATVEDAFAGGSQQFEWRYEQGEGRHLWADVTLRPTTIGADRRVVASLQDVTEYKEGVGDRHFFEELAESVGVGIGVYDERGRLVYANPALASIFGADRERLEGLSVWELNPELTKAGFERYWASFEEGETRTAETKFSVGEASVPVLSITTCGRLDGTVYHFGIVQDIADRRAYERRIAGLHDTTREMVQANAMAAVCETAVRAATATLEFSRAGIWLRDGDADVLEPVAATDGFGPTFPDEPIFADEGDVRWETFTTGEATLVETRADASGEADTETGHGELVLPLGEYGVMVLRAASSEAFSDNDVDLMKLLATNTQVALERTEREELLERQTDRMEFFNSILRHDVLNGITVMKSRAEFLLEDLEGEQRRDAETIVEWSHDVTDIVQRVRIVLESLVGEGEPDLKPVDLRETLAAELDRLETTYPDVSYERDVPEGVRVLANDLLGDVLGNVLSNAIEHNETGNLRLSVTVEERDEHAIVRVADDGTGVADDRKASIFRRDETGHTKTEGSGFGLFFVDTMIDQYGGDVHVEDNDAGGATFVIRLRTTDHATSTNS